MGRQRARNCRRALLGGVRSVSADGGPASPGDVRERESPVGTRHGSRWLPAECDVSIRPGWFWHENENPRVKTSAQLIDLYYKSVGRGANLLLNVPPNRFGRLQEEDLKSLRGLQSYLQATFREDLARAAKATSTTVRGKGAAYGAANLIDGQPLTSWATDDGVACGRCRAGFQASSHVRCDRGERGHSLRTAGRRFRSGTLERRCVGAGRGGHEYRTTPVSPAGQSDDSVSGALAHNAGVGQPDLDSILAVLRASRWRAIGAPEFAQEKT